MAVRPIIFSAPMVRALLAGRKTQTRRLATSPLRRCDVGDLLYVRETCAAEELSLPPQKVAATARERRLSGRTEILVCDELDGADGIRFVADDAWVKIAPTLEAGEAWSNAFYYSLKGGESPAERRGRNIPSIHMPRWASRLTLTVEQVRIEPLQAISSADATAEGIERSNGEWLDYSGRFSSAAKPRESFASLWQSLHTKPGERWEDNPHVVALTFSVEQRNVDTRP